MFKSAELVDAFMERQVDLGSEGRHSQTDLLAIAGLAQGLAILAVEGKAGESFGDLVDRWLDGSKGKEVRLDLLCEQLGLSPDAALQLRYQLLHRSVSAIREAKRYRTDVAALLIHSFSDDEESREDFGSFLRSLGLKEPVPGTLVGPVMCDGVRFFAGWVQDGAATDENPEQYLDDLRDYAERLAQWCDRVRALCDERKSRG